jgi:predicted RNA-binding protein with TRAM domain
MKSYMTSTTIQLDSLFDRKFEKDGEDFVIRLPADKCDLSFFDPSSPVEITLEQDGDGKDVDTYGEPPVAQGEILTIDIEEIGRQGDGIGFVDTNFVVFVPGSDVGDSVTVEIESVNDNFARACIAEQQQDTSS